MFCALSGQIATEPVVSSKSGHVFEKRLLEQYLKQEDGKCPVTGNVLSPEDIIPIVSGASDTTTTGATPRPLQATSIPGVLGLLQNEWDALMLETFTLKKTLEATRQELSQVLYQHDASCRVIARLLKEKNELLERQEVSSSMDVVETAYEGGVGKPLSSQMLSKLDAKAAELSERRKGRKATEENQSEFTLQSSHTYHRSNKPGIVSVAFHPTEQHLVLTGGVDGVGKLFDRKDGKVVGTLTGHSKKINDVLCHPQAQLYMTASEDKTVKIWQAESKTKFKAIQTMTEHTESVVDMDLHPTGDWIITASEDSTWGCFDIRTGDCLTRTAAEAKAAYSCIEYHPDGLILATGTTETAIPIWDMKTLSNVATFDGHGAGGINDVSFSENGYYMASAGQDQTVRLWDLRKLKTILTLDCTAPVYCVEFDQSGKYLAVGTGNQVDVYHEASKKKWTVFQSLQEHTAKITDVAFTQDLSSLASTSMDRSIKFYNAN